MKVEMWMDFVCPYCYLGKAKFEKALENFSDKENVEIIYKSFELNPNSSKIQTDTMSEFLSKEYGMTMEDIQENNDRLTAEAKGLGLVYNLETAMPVNSLNAHRLLQYAKEIGKEAKVVSLIFKTHFTDNKNISDIDTLAKLSKEAGLEEEKVRQILNSDKYTDKVLQDEKESQDIGVDIVPYFLINKKVTVAGEQSIETIKKGLEEALVE
ncbi:DsbA family oxidoreductase [Clostridium lacusfryxellense]|uniref:DsbA family oxidoreductase n=1 Tax=Clostridium lacusfryxellense TaxID=205328 RepID=UPI001C0D2D5A|nr:DsbA family oxidoreductase [Clostridium lacusfryxellense]MBU3114272.1 DsbA family oxidoreductase [Clostridium lacusfryxellense]